MKIVFTILFILTCIISNPNSFAQSRDLPTAELSMILWGDLDQNGFTWCEVNLYIKRTNSTPWSLGTSSFVFNFNYNAMFNPVKSGEGRWDDNTNSQYANQIIQSYNSGRAMSIEIRLNEVPSSGTVVPQIKTGLGGVFFDTDPWYAFHNVRWDRLNTVIRDNEGNDITSGMTFVDPPDGFTPVELESFTSTTSKNEVTLMWTTSKELNNHGFKIERKKSDNENPDWAEVGFVNGMGTTNNSIDYKFTDRNLQSGEYKYRLRQIDFNGNFRYYNLSNEIVIDIPDKYSLYQNYPNPFNPSTKISFETPMPSIVKLKVFDIKGEEVKTLLNEFKEPGYYSIDFDAGKLPSGIYFYLIETPRFVMSKRMMLIK